MQWWLTKNKEKRRKREVKKQKNPAECIALSGLQTVPA